MIISHYLIFCFLTYYAKCENQFYSFDKIYKRLKEKYGDDEYKKKACTRDF